MDEAEQKKLVATMAEVSDTIYRNTKRSGPPGSGLLACNRQTWTAFGFVPEEFDVWLETGVIPPASRARARAIRSKNIS